MNNREIVIVVFLFSIEYLTFMSQITKLAQRLARDFLVVSEARLPTVRGLAARHGASTRTILGALHLLRTRGLIESRPRSGYWRAGQVPAAAVVAHRLNAEKLAARLKKEILDGLHPWESPIPLIKELAALWGCHPQTVAKVLDRTIEAGLLERRGRFHFPVIPRARRKLAKPTILCLGAGAPDGHFRLDTSRESDFWSELGEQASQAGLSLVRNVWNGGAITPHCATVGVVASTWHYPEPMAVCRELARLRIPACVWVEEHILGAPSLYPGLNFHDQGYSSEIGSLVARHLLDLGHRHLAFISPWHASLWSRNRLLGIEKEAKMSGGRVDAFCLMGESEWDRLIPAASDATLATLFPSELLSKIIEGSSTRVREFVELELGWNRVYRDLCPLLENALSSGATAWIGANDPCALRALKWLRERNIPVPDRISVAGFDDNVEALRSDLTSFRFSCASMARSMIHQILSSSAASTLTRHKGVVVARQSTSAPVKR